MLPDVLDHDLKVVFCGSAVGETSARLGAYYAGLGNRFWRTLSEVGLTPRALRPQESRLLLSYGIGLTDLVKRRAGADSTLTRRDFDLHSFEKKILDYAPVALAFNGKRAARAYFHEPVQYGVQQARVGQTEVWVLPSTSGAAAGYWDIGHWRTLARGLSSLQPGP